MSLTSRHSGLVQRTDARGFTLVELLVAMVMLSLVGIVVVRMMTGSQRLTTEQAARAALQGNTRGGALIMPIELREIDPAGGDITARTDSSIQYLAPRGYGVVCSITGIPPAYTVKVFNVTDVAANTAMRYNGVRTPSKDTDDLIVFDEGDDAKGAGGDQWLRLRITDVKTTGVNCPDGSKAMQFTATDAWTGKQPSPSLNFMALAAGAPVRVVEEMELGAYDANGQSWLGARSVRPNASMQPVLGPLQGPMGVRIAYYKADGTATTGTLDVASIEVVIRGVTDRAVQRGLGSGPQTVPDSQTVRIALRNAP